MIPLMPIDRYARIRFQEHGRRGLLLLCPPCARFVLGEEMGTSTAAPRPSVMLPPDPSVLGTMISPCTRTAWATLAASCFGDRHTPADPFCRWQKCKSRVRFYASLISGNSGSRARNKLCTLKWCAVLAKTSAAAYTGPLEVDLSEIPV